jgi:hypothetical protein
MGADNNRTAKRYWRRKTPNATKIDPALMYPPYTAKKFKLIRKGMSMPDPRDVAAKARGWFHRP